MVIILLLVAFVQLFLGEFVESLVIFIVLMINSVVAVVQTKRAESSLDALRQMSHPQLKFYVMERKHQFLRVSLLLAILFHLRPVILFQQMDV